MRSSAFTHVRLTALVSNNANEESNVFIFIVKLDMLVSNNASSIYYICFIC